VEVQGKTQELGSNHLEKKDKESTTGKAGAKAKSLRTANKEIWK